MLLSPTLAESQLIDGLPSVGEQLLVTASSNA
jgi:hypothetical protein